MTKLLENMEKEANRKFAEYLADEATALLLTKFTNPNTKDLIKIALEAAWFDGASFGWDLRSSAEEEPVTWPTTRQ